jgi:hypothetical protein
MEAMQRALLYYFTRRSRILVFFGMVAHHYHPEEHDVLLRLPLH